MDIKKEQKEKRESFNLQKISLCMIVRDEEENLGRCLDHIAKYMEEVIIVDTGSTDKTKEIAKKYTDKIYDFEWIHDFSAARNYSISKATNEYVLILDSDEYVQSIDMNEIKRLIEKNPAKIGRIQRINAYTRGENSYKYHERVNRLFSKKLYYYTSIIHEQVTSFKEEPTTDNTYYIPLVVLHSGYEGDLEVRRKKTKRNIELLEIAREQYPDDSYIIYQLGKSYYMEEEYAKACDFFSEALCFDLDIRLEYVQDMVEIYGYSMINSGQYERAMQMLNIYDEFSHSTDFVFLVGLILMNNGAFQEAIQEFLKATRRVKGKMEGVNGYMAYYNIGVIYECLKDKKNAIHYYKKCGVYENAKKRLELL